MPDAAPATFNLTEKEKAILRSTLRVVVLEPDRIELAVKEPSQVRLLQLFPALGVGGALALVCVLVDDLSLAVNFVRALPLVLLILLLEIGIAPIRRMLSIGTIALFPGTAWALHRGPRGAGSARKRVSCELLTRIEPVKSKSGKNIEFNTSVRIETDLGIWTIKRRRFDETNTRRCREILSRLVGECSGFPNPSPIFMPLAQAERSFLGLPRPCYRALLADTNLVSLTPDQLVIRRSRYSLLAVVSGILFYAIDCLVIASVAYMDPPYSRCPWIATMAGVILLPRAILLADDLWGQTIRICRPERSVTVTGCGRSRRYSASACEATFEHVSTDTSSFWSASLKVVSDSNAFLRRPKELASWIAEDFADYAEWRACEAGRAVWRPEHDKMWERGARNIQAALRYYLNQSSLEEIASPAQQRPRP
jgi:hypothetical protein